MGEVVELRARGPFSLAASSRFLEEFTPADHPGSHDGHLHLAFPCDAAWQPTATCIRAIDGGVTVEVIDGDPDVAAANVARILSLDVDGSGFAEVGDRDPVIARLQADRPGLRPVGFHTPYEAAAWAVLSQRTRMTQAAATRSRIAAEHGTVHHIHDEVLHAFPPPAVLADVVEDLSVTRTKRQRLAAVGTAAMDGRLDTIRLLAPQTDEALDHLRAIDGIGPFSAELVLLRGAMAPDVAPTRERRLLAAVARLYTVDPEPDRLAEIATAWRPYRTWCSVLVRSWWDEQPQP